MKTTLTLLFTMLIVGVTAQEINRLHFDSRLGEEILIDLCDRAGLEDDDLFGSFFKDGYSSYKPQKETIKKLKAKIKGFKLIIVMGSWCHDSQVQVPRFYKVLDQAKFRAKNIKVVAVDRNKRTIGYDISKLSISYVPTMILFKDGKEVGRIVESPETSLEKDLLKIIE